MTDQVQIALIASIGPTIIGILNAVHQFSSSKKVTEMGVNIQRVETQTNSIKDALVASTALASHAEGVKDEKLRAALEQPRPAPVDIPAKPADTP